MTIMLVKGDDPALRDREVQHLVDELLAGADRSFALDDHTIASRRRAGDKDSENSENPDDDSDDSTGSEGSVELPAFTAITNALSSPPFMTSHRVVVVREIGNLTAEQAQWIAAWMADPLDGIHLVLVAGGGRVPSALDRIENVT